MAGGLAAFDYNNDGKVDMFFTNGAAIPSLQKDSPKFFNRLYRNDGGMKFTEVTLEAGVTGASYSMGAAAVGYKTDGRTDLFVAGVHRNRQGATPYPNLTSNPDYLVQPHSVRGTEQLPAGTCLRPSVA